ncbi:MAG: DUF4981 domain-containing protein [Oscillospiraceae bacterium]|nr:DUF4981 domain-containing protein [Oscillospiraceae bacterium]
MARVMGRALILCLAFLLMSGLLAATAEAEPVALTGMEHTGAGGEIVTAVGSENARANYYPYASVSDALDNYTLTPEDSPFYLGLNGEWKFHFADNPDARPWPGNGIESGFETPTFDASGWDDMAVPKNWQVTFNSDGSLKYDKIIYTNTTYPQRYYGNDSVLPPDTASVYNGVGTYRRTFTLPEGWSGREVFLNLDGVDSFYIFVNGQAVGYSQDSMTRHEFDITPMLDFQGENVIVAQVIRWGVGAWFEDQDFIRMSGVFRDIYLIARQTVDLFDFETRTTPASPGEYGGAWNLDVSAVIRDFGDAPENREGAALRARLYDGDTVVGSWDQQTPLDFKEITTGMRNPSYIGAEVSFRIQLEQPKLWSAEHPNLYKLALWVGDEATCARVGFREITWTSGPDARLLINGSRLVFYGVNIHETNPETGRAMTLDLIRADMTMMKQNNVNAIRMSHYPHDTRYYDLADEYGFYVMDEANVETHGQRRLTNQEEYGPLLRDRQSNMLERDKNYPSVVCWSVGNESGGGEAFRSYTAAWLRERDPTRPIHCEFDGNGEDAAYDMVSWMYPEPDEWLALVRDPALDKPAVMCEFNHAMGNSSGNMYSYMPSFDEPKSSGGFIWDWVDQSIWTPDGGGNWFLGYGGDWGDDMNDNDFSANGMVLADRSPKPQVAEMRYQYQQLSAELDGGTIIIINRYLFTNADRFDARWSLMRDGVIVQSGDMDIAAPPAPSGVSAETLSTARYAVPFVLPDAGDGAEYYFTLEFLTRGDTPWANAGHVVSSCQMEVEAGDGPVAADSMTEYAAGEPALVSENASAIIIAGTDFTLSVDKARGVIDSYVYQDRALLEAGPEPDFFRPTIDNDQRWGDVMPLASWRYTGRDRAVSGVAVVTRGAAVQVTVSGEFPEKNGEHKTIYTIYPSGMMNVAHTYSFGDIPDFGQVAKIGATMVAAEGLERLTWYGRGPGETYADRLAGYPVGIWSKTVDENFTDYIKPQETGNHVGTRWLTLTDESGFGLAITAGAFSSSPYADGSVTVGGQLEFNALHYSQDALTSSPRGQEHGYLLPKSRETFLQVNLASRSIGSSAKPDRNLFIDANGETFSYNYNIIPVMPCASKIHAF